MGETDIQKNNAMTRLLVDYLYKLFPDYEKYKDKTWTRESALDGKVKIYGKTLREILTSPDTLLSDQNQKNIIVFRGDREGDGKEFYLHKLIETCYEVIPHFVWEDFERLRRDNLRFRFPIVIDRDSMQIIFSKDKITMVELTEICFISQLCLESQDQKAVAKEVSLYLASNGMLAFFVGAGVCDDPLSFITTHLAPLPDSVSKLPALILFADRDFVAELSEGEDFYCVDIPPLSDEEILRYIAIEVPDCSEILRRYKRKPEALELLRKQERLLKQVQRWKRPSYENRLYGTSILEVESNYISDLIEEVLYLHKHKTSKDKDKLLDSLYEAAESELRGEEISLDTINTLKGTDCFNSNGKFTFAHCRYFLVAEKCFKDSRIKKRYSEKELEKTLQIVLENWPIEVQYYFAEIFVNGKKRGGRQKAFSKYWNALCQVLKKTEIGYNNIPAPALVLVRTMVFTNQIRSSHDLYVKWAVDSLKNENYDEKVFEGLTELRKCNIDDKDEKADIDDLLQNALLNEYNSTSIPEVRRRIIYFYSRAGYLIPNEIVKTLSDEGSDKHLRYHIVSALIETVEVEGFNSLEFYENDLHSKWVDNKKANDPILQCELETLYFKIVNRYHPRCTPIDESINSLIIKLSNGEYWEKAHSAGALCRMAGLDAEHIRMIINSFYSILEIEFDALQEGKEQNRLKTVSYVVEALCKLLERLNTSEYDQLSLLASKKISSLISKYIGLIISYETIQEVYYKLNSAVLLLICGLVYMGNPKLPLRKLLGEQFSPRSHLDDLLKISGVGEPADLIPEDIDDNLPDQLEKWIVRQEQDSLPCPSFNSVLSTKYDISVGRVFVNDKPKGMGFLIRLETESFPIIYCITCRHLFGNEIETNASVSIRPLAPKKRNLCYQLSLAYTSGTLAEGVVENDIIEDITIWRTKGVPCDIVDNIFSYNDLACSYEREIARKEKTTLHSFGFPQNGFLQHDTKLGREIRYQYLQFQGELCTFNSLEWEELTYQSEQLRNPFQGFSGVPIVDDNDRIYAMHKGDDKHKVIGVPSEKIKEYIGELK